MSTTQSHSLTLRHKYKINTGHAHALNLVVRFYASNLVYLALERPHILCANTNTTRVSLVQAELQCFPQKHNSVSICDVPERGSRTIAPSPRDRLADLCHMYET